MRAWYLLSLICLSFQALASVDSTRIEFTDRENQVRVAIHLPRDVDQLPNGLSVWKLLVKVGVEEAEKGDLEKFLSEKVIGSYYLIPLPPKDTIRIEILGEAEEKNWKIGDYNSKTRKGGKTRGTQAIFSKKRFWIVFRVE